MEEKKSATEVLRTYVARMYVIADAKGIGKTELSKALGWTAHNLDHILAGRQALTARGLDAIARYENRDLSALLKDVVLLATEMEMGAPPAVRLPSGAIVRLDVALEMIRRNQRPGPKPKKPRPR
jgi:hypothetical protein